METKGTTTFWWMKSKPTVRPEEETRSEGYLTPVPKLDLDLSSSLANFIEKEQEFIDESPTDVDIGSIIEEINKVAAQSPLGPYENSISERSVEDIMKEAERIYVESSKSFEQLSSHSKTSQNVTDLHSRTSKHSTPTPKSVSPLPLDESRKNSYAESYSEDFESRNPSPKVFDGLNESVGLDESNQRRESDVEPDVINEIEREIHVDEAFVYKTSDESVIQKGILKETIMEKENLILVLESDNRKLREDVQALKRELEQTNSRLDETKKSLAAKTLQSPGSEFERTLEELKDAKEINTALQLQLDSINKSHQLLRNSYEETLSSNKMLERRVSDLDTTLAKYKTELANVQKHRDSLLEIEQNLNRLLDVEKTQCKHYKSQNEKDARCILDLNRQIKEMERIITRKHPDSVSALIVAAKDDPLDTNLSARKLLEDRIKSLENEATARDSQSSKIFLEVQEKFNQMKLKYESHIDDLELHVADLKRQLKHKADTYDVYTQTFLERTEQKIPEKETAVKGVQTDARNVSNSNQRALVVKRPEKGNESRGEAHLLATIRGLQIDLANKEKTVMKLHRELDELRTTNKRLQKEREGSLRNLSERREFRSYPEKMAQLAVMGDVDRVDDELRAVKAERDKMKVQLCRIEGDYQNLKAKRLHDLTALQEAHEREISTYLSNITPLREQLEVQQVSLTSLQSQLSASKEELAIMTVERDHLNNRLNSIDALKSYGGEINSDVGQFHKKIAHLEKRYEEREHRLRAIVQGLAQRSITNKSCEQCAFRQQQLIGYKVELDQLLATLRSLQ